MSTASQREAHVAAVAVDGGQTLDRPPALPLEPEACDKDQDDEEEHRQKRAEESEQGGIKGSSCTS